MIDMKKHIRSRKLGEVAAEATAFGLSYGHYVAMIENDDSRAFNQYVKLNNLNIESCLEKAAEIYTGVPSGRYTGLYTGTVR